MVAILKQYKLKATPQRISILNELVKNEHPTIDELFERLKEKFPSISLATIYKNIGILKDCGVIKERVIINSKTRLDLNLEPHIDLVCLKCGKIKDIKYNKKIKENLENLKKSINTQVNEFDVIANTVCDDCKNNLK